MFVHKALFHQTPAPKPPTSSRQVSEGTGGFFPDHCPTPLSQTLPDSGRGETQQGGTPRRGGERRTPGGGTEGAQEEVGGNGT